MRFPILLCWSPKAGCGVSVVAAAAAARLAENADEAAPVTLLDLQGDQPALLGMVDTDPTGGGFAEWILEQRQDPGPYCRPATGSLRLMSAGDGPARREDFGEQIEQLAETGPVVIDAGTDEHDRRAAAGCAVSATVVCVLRTCYLALNRAQRRPGGYSWVVVVVEPGRAVSSRDVAAAVGADHVVTIPWDPQIGRAVDAGTILSTLPAPLRKFDLPAGCGSP